MKISVATCHFPVDADISRNEKYVVSQVRSAREFGADVAHFPEACLSGYAGTDFSWPRLEAATLHVLDVAKEAGLWVILGSTHRLTGRHKPHDCVYIIDNGGRLADRYDKRFCSGDANGRSADLAHYSPGNHFTTFTLKGIRCGVLICYEYAFPELYRDYKRRGVQLVFHSFHAGHASQKTVKSMAREVGIRFHRLNAGSSYPEIRMPASVQAAATANHLWVSCSNPSARHSCFPSFFVRADGIITGRLRRNVAGVLVSTVNTNERLYDGTRSWRDRAMRGTFHSGTPVRDRRSNTRTQL